MQPCLVRQPYWFDRFTLILQSQKDVTGAFVSQISLSKKELCLRVYQNTMIKYETKKESYALFQNSPQGSDMMIMMMMMMVMMMMMIMTTTATTTTISFPCGCRAVKKVVSLPCLNFYMETTPQQCCKNRELFPQQYLHNFQSGLLN